MRLVFFPRSDRANDVASKRRSSGSGPRELRTGCVAAASAGMMVMSPKRRGSLNTTVTPEDIVKMT